MRRALFVRLVVSSVLLLLAFAARSQTCWVYVDGELAKLPITCVDKVTLAPGCAWPTDCTAIPAAPGSQNILTMHTNWHNCFGNVGGSNPPPGRSQRWYAFHRQFEFDFNIWRRNFGLNPIEQLDWCPNMNLPIGTGPVNPPGPCGDGPARPDDTPCTNCVAFPQCLFMPGGGPIGCPGAPSPTCETPGGGVSFPSIASLDQFTNVDDVSKIMDGYFHGHMHQAVSDGNSPGTYNQDCATPNCSPRDPMFWRLHHAIDDIVRAWQDSKAVDIVVVVDRSGSMGDPDTGSGTSKLQAAVSAMDMFGDLLENGRSDGIPNRLGIVSYSNAPTTNMNLTNVDATLRNAGGQFDTAKTNILSGGASGCTGIGAALQRAAELLCPPGDCRNFNAPGDNDRKAILLLTDGVENVSPCLQPAGASGGSCGTQCFGPAFELDKLEFTQLVAVGFGTAAGLNGPLLTEVAERQGGIYMQNPNSATDDLKDFFAKAYANLSSEFELLDPKGTLPANAGATAPVVYNGCADSMLTFTSGWNRSIAPGALKLLVTSPNGDLVRAGDPGIEASRQNLWDFSRIRLPYRGAVSGTWRAQLVRPHNAYVNGFAPDVFADPDEGAALVRREIQRLCPDGCRNVVLFERGLRGGRSAYRDALDAERAAGLIANVAEAGDEVKLRNVLRERVDLVVYAQMDPSERAYPYDDPLASYVCQGGRAILTDARPRMRAPLFKCAGAAATDPVNWRVIRDGDLVAMPLKLVNPGYQVFTYAVTGQSLQAFADKQIPAVAARVQQGVEENWFVDVSGSTLGKLSPHRIRTTWKTGEVPIAAARMLPSYIRRGGWDHVDARVEVEYPRIGEGTILARMGLRDARRVNGEIIDPRTAALASVTIPTATATFPLNDDGTGPDVHPKNGVWTGELTGLGRTDGVYKLHYVFDLTANGCTTRRELSETMYVELGVDPKTTKVTVEPRPRNDGWTLNRVSFTPVDRLGNPLGPGRTTAVSCLPVEACKVSGEIYDDGKGGYAVEVASAPNLAHVRVGAFGAAFDVPLNCPKCPRLVSVGIEPGQVVNLQQAKGVVRLSGKAPPKGAVVYLSSDMPRVASVPESVVVPEGKSEATFPITVFHVHAEPETVTVESSYGGTRSRARITVSLPEPDPNAKIPPPVLQRHVHTHPD